ncbi:MAG: methyltransferase [Xanthomonadales bacterium]|nr:methyltransferase [Xanthomonadales bacterium]
MKKTVAVTLWLLALLPFSALYAGSEAIENAVDHPDRPTADRDRDDTRQPAQVLGFLGIEPGMHVLDLFSGGGYYTEVLSRVVGQDGAVMAHSVAAYENFVGAEALEKRYGGNRLPNVIRQTAEIADMKLKPEHFDACVMMLTYHDIYYRPNDGNWVNIDGPAMLKKIYDGMKPGGVVGIVDHVAAAGSPAEVGNTLHRIDPAIVKAEMAAAGFQFAGEVDYLRNPEDDHSKPMFDPSVRGKTDRFVYKFSKPAS